MCKLLYEYPSQVRGASLGGAAFAGWGRRYATAS